MILNKVVKKWKKGYVMEVLVLKYMISSLVGFYYFIREVLILKLIGI